MLSDDSARIKRVKVSDNPRKDPLVGEAHQIDPDSLPTVITQEEYKQLSLQGDEPNIQCDVGCRGSCRGR